MIYFSRAAPEILSNELNRYRRTEIFQVVRPERYELPTSLCFQVSKRFHLPLYLVPFAMPLSFIQKVGLFP
jgi:hypothetical protein